MDPSDPHSLERADHEVLETIEIATAGEDCDECVRKLRAPLMRVSGVKDVKIDLGSDAILKSGYKPAPMAG